MSYALARQMSAVMPAVDAGMARRDQQTARDRSETQFDQQQQDRATNLERSETQFNQQQEDRDFALQRRDVETERADAEYERLEGNRQRKVKVNDALKAFAVSGNVDGMKGVANEYGIPETTYDIQKNDDGTFTRTTIDKDGNKNSEVVDADELASSFMIFNDDDFAASLREKRTKAGERKHELAKMTKEYELKRGLEHVKGGYKEGGKSGTSKGGKSLPAYQKELADLSKENYGGTYENGTWSFDSELTKRKAATHSDLAGAYYMSAEEGDTNAAHRKALRSMAQFEALAVETATKEVDDGTIDDADYEGRVANLIDAYTDHTIKKMAPTPGQQMEAGGGGATTADQAGQQGGELPSWEQYLADAMAAGKEAGMGDDEIKDAAKQAYESFGGSVTTEEAAPAETPAPALERPTKEGEEAAVAEDTTMSIPGVSDAQADEAPKLNRKKEEEAAQEAARIKEQSSGISDKAMKRTQTKRKAELASKQDDAQAKRGSKKAKAEQATQLRRYRKLKSSARAKIMSKKQLSLALLAAESKKEKEDIIRLLKEKAK